VNRSNVKRHRSLRATLAALLGLWALLSAASGAGAQSPETVDALIGQIKVAINHGTLSFNSANMTQRLTHAHHVVNILEGRNGPNFDQSKGNPGDGYGAINYALDAAKGATGDAAPLAANTLAFLQFADAEAVKATKAETPEEAAEAIRRAVAFLSAALGREDEAGLTGAALALKARSQPKIVTIDILDFRFGDGQPLTVKVGTTVTWINHDSAPHTVTGGPLNSGTMNQHATYSYTFTEPGTYDYICAYHPNMRHRIIVVE